MSSNHILTILGMPDPATNAGKVLTLNITEDGLEYTTVTPGSGTVTSVGLTTPSGFSVTGSPVTGSGTLAITGAGTISQYIRGDGTLGTLPNTFPISSLLSATGVNTIDNGTFGQSWNWSNLIGNGLQIASSSTAANGNQQLLQVILNGANANSAQTTISLNVANTHTGTSSTNVAGRFFATSGTNNYALDLTGAIRINGTSGGVVTLQTQAAAGTYTLTLPNTDGNASEFLQTDGSGNLSWAAALTSVRLDQILAATTSNNINNANNGQIWTWNTLGANSGLYLSSSSTAAASNVQTVLYTESFGANSNSTQTTFTSQFLNYHSGTSSTNIAIRGQATGGTINKAALFDRGFVELGTVGTESGVLKINGSTSGTITIQPAAIAGTWTLTLPTTDGNSGEFLQTNGSGVTSWVVPSPYTFQNGIYNASGVVKLGGILTEDTTIGTPETEIYDLTIAPNNFLLSAVGDANISAAADVIIAAGSDLIINNIANDDTKERLLAINSSTNAITYRTVPSLESGIYTPTLTGITNVAASTAHDCVYTKIGEIRHIAGSIEIDPTATGLVEIELSLPTGEGLTGNVGGAGFNKDVAGLGFYVTAGTGGGALRIAYTTTDTSNRLFSFSATYEILPL